MKKSPLLIVFFTFFTFTVSCIQPVSQGGGGSEVEVIGVVYQSKDKPACSTQVKLIHSYYDPSKMGEVRDSMIDTTDGQGRYTFTNVTPGIYNVQAVQLEQRTRLLVTGIDVKNETTYVRPDTLRKPGSVKIFILNEIDEGYVIIPGTDIAVSVPGGSSEILIDSVPAGNIPEIQYTSLGDSIVLSKKNVLVKSSDTTILSGSPWNYLRRIHLNTASSGADIESDVYSFPVLIRLDESNFNFSAAKDDGGDIRFTSAEGKSLPHEIEQWDAINGSASIWVKVDTIYGNNNTQSIIMYWGNSEASNTSNGTLVFDTVAGFQGVWHLSDQMTNTVYDATVNRYHGYSPENGTPANDNGVIGNCRTFNGTSDYINIDNTSDSKLNCPHDGYYMVSAWVYLDTLDGKTHCIVSKGYTQYYLRIYNISQKPPYAGSFWEFVEFNGENTWHVSNNTATRDQWVLLTGVRQGSQQYLYCNGVMVDSTIDIWENGIASRNTTEDLIMGRFADAITIPANEGFCYFKGGIDEVRILNAAKSPDWIKLCYMNQRSDDLLVEFR